jgi:hypothetical protein
MFLRSSYILENAEAYVELFFASFIVLEILIRMYTEGPFEPVRGAADSLPTENRGFKCKKNWIIRHWYAARMMYHHHMAITVTRECMCDMIVPSCHFILSHT